MKTEKEILLIDPAFDFDNAYQVNTTLHNVVIAEVSHGPTFQTIDGMRELLSPARTLYVVMYRYWQNQHLFSLAMTLLGRKEEFYWTTKDKASNWFSKCIPVYFELLSRQEALAAARESMQFHEATLDRLKKNLKNYGLKRKALHRAGNSCTFFFLCPNSMSISPTGEKNWERTHRNDQRVWV